MKLICIEEHAVDPAITRAAQPVLETQAPYLSLQRSSDVVARTGITDRPSLINLTDALTLGTDLGDGRIQNMDQHGIDVQVVSYTSPVQHAPVDQAPDLARAANDRLAHAIRENPTRLSGFAVLPWQDPVAAVDELDRAVGALGLKGVLLAGRPGDSFLDDPFYRPVLDKLSKLGTPLYLHPFHPLREVQQAYYAGFSDEVSTMFSLGGWGWHHEAGIHVVRLILAGVFDRFPGLQVISGHWGEMVPFYLQRLDDMLPTRMTGLTASITETYRKHVWITPSGMFHEPHFEFVRSVVGLDRVLWSVDYPFLTLTGTRQFLEDLELTDEERHQIAHRNVEDLLGL